MPQSLALVLVHIIFSTKNRMAFLQSTELRSEEFRSMSVMCGIDQNQTLGPFRANRLMDCAPGVKTPG